MHMDLLLDFVIAAISLVFLTILGMIAGVAIPGLFMAAAAPWLDWILPFRNKKQSRRPSHGREVLRRVGQAPRGSALSARRGAVRRRREAPRDAARGLPALPPRPR